MWKTVTKEPGPWDSVGMMSLSLFCSINSQPITHTDKENDASHRASEFIAAPAGAQEVQGCKDVRVEGIPWRGGLTQWMKSNPDFSLPSLLLLPLNLTTPVQNGGFQD